MKKAKEYAKQFQDDPSSETLESILTDFFYEIEELKRVRHARTSAALFAILDEQDRKWRAFARRVEGIKEDGFECVVKELVPQVYASWRPDPRPTNQARETLISLAILGQMWRDR